MKNYVIIENGRTDKGAPVFFTTLDHTIIHDTDSRAVALKNAYDSARDGLLPIWVENGVCRLMMPEDIDTLPSDIAASLKDGENQFYAAIGAILHGDDDAPKATKEAPKTSALAEMLGLSPSTKTPSLGASGIDMTNGSSLDVRSDSAMMSELDALTIRNNAMREAWGHRHEAKMLEDDPDAPGRFF